MNRYGWWTWRCGRRSSVTTFVRGLVLIALLSVSGCETGAWTHPTKTEQDFEIDKHACEMEAAQYASNIGAAGNPFIIADEMGTCLKLKGWKREAKK